jgi:glycosyltransferase involved in cell wall biosynthesis
MENMRIAYLINQYPKVSHSFIRREINALESKGVEVLRIALRGWDNDLVDELDHRERRLTRYVLRGGPFALLLSILRTLVTNPLRLFQAFQLAWAMGRAAERPLPIHIVYLAEACTIASWLRNAHISHLHAHFGTNAAEVAMLVNALGGPSWSFTVHGPEEFDKASLIKLDEKLRRANFIAAVSSYGRSQLMRLVASEHWSKIKIIHCGVDTDFYDRAGSEAQSSPRLVCVGRLSAQKGHLILIEATRRLVEEGVRFELVLAGDGELRAEIESAIKRYGLQKFVRITGWVSSEQVRDEILAARALVLPSFAEGLPVVIMEAMALHRPVISTFIAGIPELVRPHIDGWLVPAGDVQGLVAAIRECLEAPVNTLARMGRDGHERVLARHNVDDQAEKLKGYFAIASSD